ncbi:hypothetical protein HIM_01093 [Hirsutella minnesotensis 3608]|nr:hypothetical protein HIM_01093 [Hirsutella minnesotensis 3608]
MQRSESSSRDVSQAEESDTASASEPQQSTKHRNTRRGGIATVYDAAAGRVWPEQPLREETADGADSSRGRGDYIKHSTRSMPMPPDEVLFRRKGAPERYQEYDVYNAHTRDLPRSGRGILPESDLLKAIHGYTSRFYGALGREKQTQPDWRNVDERSMDETALLAFGILLEEAGRNVLGRRGDLVFTEGAEASDDTEEESDTDIDSGPGANNEHGEPGASWKLKRKGAKRQKVVDSKEQ